jgi:dTDP-4-dehydrorhamnose reductase
MTRFLVTGASGLLGLNFSLQAAEKHNVFGIFHKHGLKDAPFTVVQSDLISPGEIQRVLEKAQPEVILHCAALANLDVCEANPEKAFQINTRVPGELAVEARRLGIKMVHISTDAVFDGQSGEYTETDPTNPINTYARTKLAGEQAVMDANPDALIARVVFYGWSLRGARSLGEWFVNNLSASRQVYGFTDVFLCPQQVN